MGVVGGSLVGKKAARKRWLLAVYSYHYDEMIIVFTIVMIMVIGKNKLLAV